jgi:hypothetical protein
MSEHNQSGTDAPCSIFIHDIESVIGIISGRTKYSILVMQDACKTDTHDVILKSLEICTWLLMNHGINEVRIVCIFSDINKTNSSWIVMDSPDAKSKYDRAFNATNGFRDHRYNQSTFPYIVPSMARTNHTLSHEMHTSFLKYNGINQVFLTSNIPLTKENEHIIYIYNINIRNQTMGDIIISYTEPYSFSLFYFDLFPNAGSILETPVF